MELNFREGLQRGQTIGKAAQVLAGLVALSSGLCAIGVTLFINGNWPDALIGTYDFHGLDMLLLADFLILVASFFVVGAWIWRAHKNIELTDAFVTEFSPGWAIGWFAVPIANLFKPFQAMKALWQSSHGEEVDSSVPAVGLLWVWWISWLLGGLGGFGEVLSMVDVAGYTATVVSAVCIIQIIREINAAQPNMSIANTFS